MPTIRTVLRCASEQGAGRDALCAVARIDPRTLEDIDGRVPLSSFDRLIEAIVDALDQTHFGLAVGRHAATREMSSLYYLISSSDSLGAALRRLCSYSRLVGDGAVLELTQEGSDACALLYVVDGALRSETVVRYTIESWTLSLVGLVRYIAGSRLGALEVALPPPCTVTDSVYAQAYGVEPVVAGDHARVRFSAAALDARTPGADPHLHLLMHRQADRALASLPKVDDLRSLVIVAIERELADRTMTVERAAARLGTSPRSLQRRLHEAGLSFRELVDAVRESRACQYMRDASISVDEAAYLLGFSTSSAFGRAFRRWTQMSPQQYRRAAH